MKQGNQGDGDVDYTNKDKLIMGSNLIQLAKAGNVAANIFYLKTQAGWKEEQADIQEIPQINIIVDGNAINPPTE